MPKSLTEQIIELMPEEKETNNREDEFGEVYEIWKIGERDQRIGFNQARTEMINKIPEILSLIRGEVEDIRKDTSTSPKRALTYIEVCNGCGSEGICNCEGYNQALDDLLEKLK